jgi:serine-type D-Ala-D-Ala carboxypeptidase/endopeptidase
VITWHNGGTGGDHSFIGFNPDTRTAVVVLDNAAASIDDIGFHLLDAGFALATVKPLPRPRAEVSLRPEVLQPYVGTYVLSPAFAIDVTREGDHLFIQATRQPRLPVFAESETSFFLKAVDAGISFVKGPDGSVTELVLHQNGTASTLARTTTAPSRAGVSSFQPSTQVP